MRQMRQMRQRLVLASLMICTLSACGGASSETPPPLQPDPKGFRYASAVPSPVSATESDAGAAPIGNELDGEEKPRAPARPTWGSSKPAH